MRSARRRSESNIFDSKSVIEKAGILLHKHYLLLIILTFFILSNIAGVSSPSRYLYDEGYYIPAAQKYLRKDLFTNIEHPPLGKILISVGILIFGDNPVGWRIIPFIFGIVGVCSLYFLAMAIFDNSKIALLASFLLVVDMMWSTFSTLAMLDIFVATALIIAAYWLWSFIELPTVRKAIKLGLILGLATAIKWVAVFFIIALAILVIVRQKYDSDSHFLTKYFISFGASFFVAYFLPYLFFLGKVDFVKIISLQFQALKIHIDAGHVSDPDAIPPWLWFWINPYVSSRYVSNNPLIFFIWPLVFISKTVEVIKNFSKKKDFGFIFILVCFSSLYFPWYITKRPTYAFYVIPAVPFICLALGVLLNNLWMRNKLGKCFAASYIFAAFVLYLTTHTGS